MDNLDIELLKLIQLDCRISNARLGELVGLSTSAVNARLSKLKKQGVIETCAALIDPAKLGLGILAFVQVLIDRPEHEPPFLHNIKDLPEVLECHHVTGDFSYLLKVQTRDTALFEAFLLKIKSYPGLVRTLTLIALSSPKKTTALPLYQLASDGELE